MGRNAQTKRRDRDEQKQPAKKETTEQRLRRRMAQVTSLEQYAQILAAIPAGHRYATRAYLDQLLPKQLPCCTLAKYGEHTPGCLKILTDMKAPAATARFN